MEKASKKKVIQQVSPETFKEISIYAIENDEEVKGKTNLLEYFWAIIKEIKSKESPKKK